MQHITKNFCRITFSNSYKNFFYINAIKESVLGKNVVTKSNIKLAFSQCTSILTSYSSTFASYDSTLPKS